MDVVRYSIDLQIDIVALEKLVQEMPNISLAGDELQAYFNKLMTYGDLFVALDGVTPNALLGFYANNVDTKVAYLSCIVVSSSLRGQGIGQQLFSKMCMIARERDMAYLQLDVAKENKNAIMFYEKNNCVIIGNGRTDEYWLMEKVL